MSLRFSSVRFSHAALLILLIPAAIPAQGEKEVVSWVEGSVLDESVVCASGGQDQMAREFAEGYRSPFKTSPPFARAYGIAVRAAETTRHQMAIYAQPNKTTFKLTRHDGRPVQALPKDRVTIHYGSVWGGGSATSIVLDANGVGPFSFDRTGLVRIGFPYKETPILSAPIKRPYWSPDGIVAVSARLPDAFPVELTAVEHRGGSLLVKLFDADGEPRSGLVRVGNKNFNDVSVDNPKVEDVDPGTWPVEGRVSGVTRVFPDNKMGTMPSDEVLIERSEILSTMVTIGDNEEQEVELRPEKIGYVRGSLVVPMGRKASEFRMSVSAEAYQQGAGVFLHPGTGQFLAGPFRAGKSILNVFPAYRYPMLPLARHEVDVVVGRVTETEISVPDVPTEKLPESRVFIGMAGISERADGEQPTGRVLFADGQTPARSAMVAAYHPVVRQLVGAGMTDATGAIRPRSFFVSRGTEIIDSPGTPHEPVAIAWLPGGCGAAIVPLPEKGDEPLSIRLPPPIALRGKVVVTGDGETIDDGTVTVRAQFEGRGKLDDLLSVEATAGADGAFELAGLTPGNYRVQAALDGIWLSPTAALAVSEKDAAGMEPLRLTIPQPGGPVLVRLTGERSRSPEKLTMLRPAGPLCDRLWPKFLTPDGAGIVRIPALEAGKHAVRVGNVEKTVEVLPLAESKGRPVELELILGPGN